MRTNALAAHITATQRPMKPRRLMLRPLGPCAPHATRLAILIDW
jgi:hypothetical protein